MTNRRQFLKTTGLGLGAWMSAGVLGGCATTRNGATSSAATRGGSIRVAHLTDVHVQHPRGATRGMAQCFRHAQSLPHKPELVLNTGDCVMDVLQRDRARAQVLWDLWASVLKDECSLPIAHCLGNHDIWGWGKQSGTSGNEPGWGKGWAMDVLGLAKPYHAFDRGAWRFIMLDSCQPTPADGAVPWEARLDEAQFAWLASELAATRRPVLIASHVPIFSPAATLRGNEVGRGSHADFRALNQLFLKHRNVKLCVSGHLHQIDRAEYRGVTYVTNPAVSGAWWKGDHLDAFGEMYTLLDLHADGTFDLHHVDYGWTPQAEPATAPAAAAAVAE